MPVTHGVAGSSPVRTANTKQKLREIWAFFVLWLNTWACDESALQIKSVTFLNFCLKNICLKISFYFTLKIKVLFND